MRGVVLVTGAAGFIGCHCCRRLLADGWSVVGIDNFDPFHSRSLKESALQELSADPGFRFVDGDIRRREDLDALMGGIDLVVHLAARAGVRPSIAEPDGYAATNVA